MGQAITIRSIAALFRAGRMLLLGGAGGAFGLMAGWAQASPPGLVITNLAGLHTQLTIGLKRLGEVRFEAVVCTASPSGRKLILADDSGAELVMLEAGTSVTPGQRVLLAGTGCELTRLNWGIAFSQPPVVDNDGVHGAIEKSGSVCLPEGRIPLPGGMVQCRAKFCPVSGLPGTPGPAGSAFPTACSSGEMTPRFWHSEPGAMGFIIGVLKAVGCRSHTSVICSPSRRARSATSPCEVRTRNDYVGLEFTGFIEIKQAGEHQFYLTSDDGARLFVGEPSPTVTLEGRAAAAARPWTRTPGAVSQNPQKYQWVEFEGVVQDIVDRSDCVEIELKSGQDQLRVGLLERAGLPVQLLLNSKVRVRGVRRDAFRPDGTVVFGLLETVSTRDITIEQLAPELMASVPIESVAAARAENGSTGGRILRLAGQIRTGQVPGTFEITEGTNTLPMAMSLGSLPPEGKLEAFGQVTRQGTDTVFQCGFMHKLEAVPPAPSDRLPTLTTAEQVQRLTRKEAERGFPVRLRGVITCDAPELFYGNVIQDQTRGIYFYWHTNSQPPFAPELRPHFGEYWEIEGVTGPGGFAPTILVQKMTCLGEGQLPTPLNPSWDQLMSGGLDTQLIEIQGIITDTDLNGLIFLTHGGKIRIDFDPTLAEEMRRHKNSLVRLRGCVLTLWDSDTHRMKLGEIRLGNLSLAPDASESLDPFNVPQKNVEDLLLYDAAAGAFQRVKIAGQLVASRGEESYLMNGAKGLRFVPREPVRLKPGALLEVAGVPELGGPSPILREAAVRQAGWAPLPAPRPLTLEQLPLAENDATRVRLAARLNGIREAGAERFLDLQAGDNFFTARLPGAGPPGLAVEPGSRLELTGVYMSLNGARGAYRSPGEFEIMLASASDVRILSRPPWLTLGRLLAVIGGLGAVLVLAALWITQLRRRVEERTAQLRQEIHAREQAEQQRMVAEEKSRIARDLHDDLGSSLTEIGLQANVAQRTQLSADQMTEQFGVIADKTRAMVSALDVIVWTVDPEENTLQATADYLGGYAEEFLAASGLERRFKIPVELPPVTVDGHTRHGLFLAVKEALNNIVRHARASAVEFSIAAPPGVLKIEITDNGIGFDPAAGPDGHGVVNLQKRLASLGGNCQIQSQPGAGTRIEITLPLKI